MPASIRVIFGVDVASMLLGGLAAGMVLFIVSVGLSVTMGLMGFVNLAHGGFAMLGGYVIVLAMNASGLGFVPALAFGFVATAAVSAVLERLLYARLYRAAELDQVLFTIGLVFVMIAVGDAPDRARRTSRSRLPRGLQGQIDLGFTRYRTYSILLIVVGVAIALGLWLGFERTRIGAQIRAAVDNRRMAESLGINVDRLFTLTFAFGSGMAALGGGLGAEFLGLDPQYALKYLVYFLIVVAVGGLGPRDRRVLRGAADRRARLRAQEIPAAGRHAVHLRAHDPAPAVAAAGPVRTEPMAVARGARLPAAHPAALALIERHRLRIWEPLPWLLAHRLAIFAFPRHLGFGTELLITILFALSLDLVLGYAGIVTLGHAAFFGAGAYTVGHAGQSRYLERADHRPARRARPWRRSSGSAPAWCCCAPPASRC